MSKRRKLITCPHCGGTGKEPISVWERIKGLLSLGLVSYDRACTKCEGLQQIGIYEEE